MKRKQPGDRRPSPLASYRLLNVRFPSTNNSLQQRATSILRDQLLWKILKKKKAILNDVLCLMTN